jgi:hypothetical protein
MSYASSIFMYWVLWVCNDEHELRYVGGEYTGVILRLLHLEHLLADLNFFINNQGNKKD